MDQQIVLLALLMGLVTFPTRLAAFFLPMSRIPDRLGRAVRLMGPASLAAVAAVTASQAAGLTDPGGELATVVLPATAACVGLVALSRNLAIGLLGAVATGAALTFIAS